MTDLINLFLEKTPKVIASLGGTAGIILLLKEFYRLFMRSKMYKVEKVLENHNKIQHHLNLIASKTNAESVLMFKLHDGGAEIRTGHPIYSTLIHETSSDKIESQFDKWKKVKLDDEYLNIVHETISSENKKIMVYQKDLKPCILKDIMKSFHIPATYIVHVYTHKPKPLKFFTSFKEENLSALWYLSIPFMEEKFAELSAHDRMVIDENIRAISDIIKESKRYD